MDPDGYIDKVLEDTIKAEIDPDIKIENEIGYSVDASNEIGYLVNASDDVGYEYIG